MVNYFGIEIPTSIRAVEPGKHFLRYVRPPRNSLTWQGAEWKTPVSLDFRTEEIERQEVVHYFVITDEESDPMQFVRRIEGGTLATVGRTAVFLREHGYVLDTQGLRTRAAVDHFREGALLIRTSGWAWPAVEGVTVPISDSTI